MSTKTSTSSDRASLFLVCLISLVGFLGASIAYPILPVIFVHPALGGVISDQLNAHWRGIFLGITLATYPIGQFIGAPLLGAASDKFGRKPVLVASLLGAAIGYLMTVIALNTHSLWLLIISRFITGAMEGNIAIARSIAIDLKSIPKQISLGRINAVSAIGYTIGPILGGLLSSSYISPHFNFATPFYLAMLTTLIGIGLTVWLLNESHRIKPPSRFQWSELNIPARLNKLCKNKTIKWLLISSTIFTLGIDIYYEFGPVYLTSQWNMSATMIAMYNLILSLTLAAGSLLTYTVSKCMRINTAVKTCMLITATILLLIALIPTKLSVFILFGLSGFTITIANTNFSVLLSDNSSEAIQGEVMGTQLGLRMLGDGVICLLGGLMLASSAMLPILISSLAAGAGLLYFHSKFNNHKSLAANPES